MPIKKKLGQYKRAKRADPFSVVRESEFWAAEKTGDFPRRKDETLAKDYAAHKAADPGSVVRESEWDAARRARSTRAGKKRSLRRY